MNTEMNCLYCGQRIVVVNENGRPKATQNGKPHQCSFSVLGISASLVERSLADHQKGRGQIASSPYYR